ncbi:MAG TPA: hypothetical protein VNZ02_12115 [Steroidobacteraceae bacterium]|nr:hypothetical protein [Steroidobacteraceae bacterium]
MRDLRQALAEINAIRTQVARDTQFRGYGPISIAASGVLALIVAAVQSGITKDDRDFFAFFLVWASTALIAVGLTATEMIRRTRRVHSGLANEMIQAAVEQFLPALVVGLLLTAVLIWAAPQQLWMLPGLWQLLFSLGVFASCRFLPRQTFAVGIWYLIAGLTCLALQSGPKTFSPWSMGIPFGVGQLLVAAVLQYGFEKAIEDA